MRDSQTEAEEGSLSQGQSQCWWQESSAYHRTWRVGMREPVEHPGLLADCTDATCRLAVAWLGGGLASSHEGGISKAANGTCGYTGDKCRCTLPAGHEGFHECSHGKW